jgi:hypothetical protein
VAVRSVCTPPDEREWPLARPGEGGSLVADMRRAPVCDHGSLDGARWPVTATIAPSARRLLPLRQSSIGERMDPKYRER